jgi:hypothetical protein
MLLVLLVLMMRFGRNLRLVVKGGIGVATAWLSLYFLAGQRVAWISAGIAGNTIGIR